MNDQWCRIINGSIRVYDASAQTLAKERGQSAPQLTRYLLGDHVVVEGLSVDPDLALAAVSGRLDGDRDSVLWIIADATARVVDQAMHVRLRDNPEALAIATQQIFDELACVAYDPLRWTYFSLPWGEPDSELAVRSRRRAQGG